MKILLLILYPIVPHITHQLWLDMGNDTAIVNELWPQVDASALLEDTIQYVLQVNGKPGSPVTFDNLRATVA